MKKKLALALAAVMMIGLFAGCGGQIYQDHDHTPLLCSIKRAPISEAPTKLYGYRSL